MYGYLERGRERPGKMETYICLVKVEPFKGALGRWTDRHLWTGKASSEQDAGRRAMSSAKRAGRVPVRVVTASVAMSVSVKPWVIGDDGREI